MTRPSQSRFADFDNYELAELWKGLTMDDGISYSVAEDDPIYPAARELYAEAKRRGLVAANEHLWENVL